MYRLKSPAVWSSLFSLLSLVNGQDVTPAPPGSSSTPSTSSRVPITRTVSVGKADHSFEPDITQAQVGDFVEFHFFPKNHSVVRAAYKSPCVPFEMVETDKVGFSSGFQPVDAILDEPPKWTIRINDSDPIFFYCSALGSCIRYGMVGVINPSASTSLQVQRDDAKKSNFMLQPGESWPNEADPSGPPGSNPSSASESSTARPTASISNAPASATGEAVAVTKSPTLSPGAIAGIAIGGAVVVLMAVALIYLCGRNRALSNLIHPNRSQPPSGDFGGNGVHYVQAVPKHMSGMTMGQSRPQSDAYMHHSPALPGYVGPQDGPNSPPRTYYAPSDALSPATTMVRSASPASTGVPAYSHSPPLPSKTPVEHDGDGPHEMEGNAFYRSISTQKGRVERYS